jgi:hypothetical protein
MSSYKYYLYVKPKYISDHSVYEKYCSGASDFDAEDLASCVDYNVEQRCLIRDIIQSESVNNPTIEPQWDFSSVEDRCFSKCVLRVSFDESCGMTPSDCLTCLRYIGEELFPWVDSVILYRK